MLLFQRIKGICYLRFGVLMVRKLARINFLSPSNPLYALLYIKKGYLGRGVQPSYIKANVWSYECS